MQADIAATPGRKRAVGRALDTAIAHAAPGARKAVRWNPPFCGMDGRGWCLGFHCDAKFVRVAFFRGGSLEPRPPGASKQPDVRCLDLREDTAIDAAQLAEWIRQAVALPGWTP